MKSPLPDLRAQEAAQDRRQERIRQALSVIPAEHAKPDERRFLRRRLKRALDDLRYRERFVFIERYFEERTQADIGADLGISRTRVGTIERYALRHLQAALRKQETETPVTRAIAKARMIDNAAARARMNANKPAPKRTPPPLPPRLPDWLLPEVVIRERRYQ